MCHKHRRDVDNRNKMRDNPDKQLTQYRDGSLIRRPERVVSSVRDVYSCSKEKRRTTRYRIERGTCKVRRDPLRVKIGDDDGGQYFGRGICVCYLLQGSLVFPSRLARPSSTVVLFGDGVSDRGLFSGVTGSGTCSSSCTLTHHGRRNHRHVAMTGRSRSRCTR